MEPLFVLADMYVKSSPHDVANSAMPDAPVLPYVERRARRRRLVAVVKGRDRWSRPIDVPKSSAPEYCPA